MSGWRSAWCPVVVAAASAFLLLAGVVVPGGYYTVLLLALTGWAAAAVLWLMAGARHLGRPVGQWWPLVLVPALFATSWAFASGGLAGRALFSLHRPALERAVPTAARAPGTTVGLYSFRTRFKSGKCWFLDTEDPGMSQNSGFVRCPGSPSTMHDWDGPITFEPIEGDWYAYRSGRPDGVWGLRLSRFGPRIET
ncbi:hypothetical protein [Lentzea flaviverrucosa]|uniref:Uncharacterized protein n=1 Tax=Lentzea flaviverrucosa TaxID=200379 RepID=A0A1H8ZTR0_9PSEU|nr:hypothetical protein [Lentzea flaviverrucosa]RDI32251.1 hypothetical protein DFR72_103652 [Lentzea flaviverrucosa]SEP67822.1 hypothetical protein SAMN05216195_1016 [Lentzea flaviverrucosa]